jgi:hypothetical protein
MGSDGTLAINLEEAADRRARVSTISIDGTVAELVGYSLGGRSVNGSLPVASPLPSAGDPDGARFASFRFGWWKEGSGQELAASGTYAKDTPGLNRLPVVHGARWAQLEERSGEIVLIARSPTATVTIPIPGATSAAQIIVTTPGPDDRWLAQIMPTTPGPDDRWLLVATGIPNQIARVDLRNSTETLLNLAAPAGYRPYGRSSQCSPNSIADQPLEQSVGWDEAGYVYARFRAGGHAAVFATVDGANWSQVGASTTGRGVALELAVIEETYALWGHMPECFVPPPSDGSEQYMTQVFRRRTGKLLAVSSLDSDEGYILSTGRFSRTGRYAASWVADKAKHAEVLRVLDIETGTLTDLSNDPQGFGFYHAPPAWLSSP